MGLVEFRGRPTHVFLCQLLGEPLNDFSNLHKSIVIEVYRREMWFTS